MSLEMSINNLDRINKELALELKEKKIGEKLKIVEFILDNLKTKAIIITSDYEILYFNKSFGDFFGKYNLKVNLGDNWWQKMYDSPIPKEWCPVKEAIASKKVIKKIIDGEITKSKYSFVCVPLIYNGISGVIAFIDEET